MKYVVYFQAPLVSGDKHDLYLNEQGNFTTQQERARVFTVDNILSWLLIILQLIVKHRKNFKYKRI